MKHNDNPLSNFAFNFNLRHYSLVTLLVHRLALRIAAEGAGGGCAPGYITSKPSAGNGTAEAKEAKEKAKARAAGEQSENAEAAEAEAEAAAAVVVAEAAAVLASRVSSSRRRQAWLAGALFAVHPVHTEAVAGLVGRAELLCGRARSTIHATSKDAL